MKRGVWLAFWAFGLSASDGVAQVRVEVIVMDVKDTTGMIRVGIFDNPETFLKKPIMGKTVRAVAGRCVVLFEQVPVGMYAISVIHDSNRNEKLDTNFIGIPKEGFGFTNDAMGKFGPPSFEKAKVRLKSTASFTIHLRYR